MALTAQDNAYSKRINRTIKRRISALLATGNIPATEIYDKKSSQSIQQQKITSAFKEIKSNSI
jgi:hypothetical protein